MEHEKAMRRDLRRYFGTTGWALLIYYGLMNVSMLYCQLAELVFAVWGKIIQKDPAGVMEALWNPPDGTWGYFLAAALGFLMLLAWKKRDFWVNQIWAKGKAMQAVDFFCLLCVFLSAQLFSQVYSMALELLTNSFGYSILEGFNEISINMDSFGMFLYGGMLAPVAEEILFRGLIQRTLMPYGKRFAILCSAFAFGMFHGNIIQVPYAFLCGLVLGYVAAEYSIAWAMLLHMINNLVLAELLTRVTAWLPEMAAAGLFYCIIMVFAILAMIILILRRREIRDYRAVDPIHPECARCFFSSAGVIAFTAVMGLSIVVTFFGLLVKI